MITEFTKRKRKKERNKEILDYKRERERVWFYSFENVLKSIQNANNFQNPPLLFLTFLCISVSQHNTHRQPIF